MGSAGEADRRQVACDTNVIVRLVTQDPPIHARAARRFLDRAEEDETKIYVSDVVVAELTFVLTSVYAFSDADAAVGIKGALDHPSIALEDAGAIYAALDLWSVTALDFVDAYLSVLSWTTPVDGVLSFDRDFDKVLGATRIDPGAE